MGSGWHGIEGDNDGRRWVLHRFLPRALGVATAAVGIAWLLGGCGGAPVTSGMAGDVSTDVSSPVETPAATSPVTAESDSSRPAVSAARVPASEWVPAPDDIAGVLGDAAGDAAGLQLYVPGEVPLGTRVADYWSDVLAVQTPSASATTVSNPRVNGTGATAEVTLVLEVSGGRLAFVQNVHGDLGDLPGRPVGTVEGHLATAYRMLGADVVQWEDAGHWYAVMGTGVAASDVERFALSMRPL